MWPRCALVHGQLRARSGRLCRGATGGREQARHVSHVSTFVRHTRAGGRLRYPPGTNAARPRRPEDHDDLHARDEPTGRGGDEPARQARDCLALSLTTTTNAPAPGELRCDNDAATVTPQSLT